MSSLAKPLGIITVQIHSGKDKYYLTLKTFSRLFSVFQSHTFIKQHSFCPVFLDRKMEHPNKSTFFVLICSSFQIPSVLPIFYIPTPSTRGIKAWKPQIKNKSFNPGDKRPSTASSLQKTLSQALQAAIC